jgi:hypothetical protein
MALPGSGQLSLGDIAGELGVDPPLSLRSMSNSAGFSTPDAVSEFYGYSGAVTYTYYATWAADDPCNYDYYDIYEGSDGIYYRYSGVAYYPMYDHAEYWYEYLYYEPMFDPFGNIYNEWIINSTSTVLTNNGLTNSSC